VNPIKALMKKIRRANRVQAFAIETTCSFCPDTALYKYEVGYHVTYLCGKCYDVFGFEGQPGIKRLS
jgi:hypothetical protein